jgi:hypothetical protein
VSVRCFVKACMQPTPLSWLLPPPLSSTRSLADVLTMPMLSPSRVCSFYLKQKMWWVGIVVFTIGNIMVSTLPVVVPS